MAVTPTYPGVYVQEVPSGVRTIAGVSTSITLFLGRAARGPVGEPVLCLSYLDFARTYGEDVSAGQLPHHVRLFYLNGGSVCWVVRLAHGATAASVKIKNEAGVEVLELTAHSAGAVGNDIRAIVTYAGAQPEATFTLELFRWELQGTRRVPVASEVWSNLSMDRSSPTYAPDVITQGSQLVRAALVASAPAAVAGFSESGRPVAHADTDAAFQAAWHALLGDGAPATNGFQISIAGSTYAEVSLAAINVAAMSTLDIRATGLPKAIKDTIEAALPDAGVTGRTVEVSFPDGPTPDADITTVLRITSGTVGDVFVRPGSPSDLAVPLMLGTAQGGLEVGAHAGLRPAPSGVTLKGTSSTDLHYLRGLLQSDVDGVTLPVINDDGTLGTQTVDLNLETLAPGAPWYEDNVAASPNGNNDGLREKLGLIAAAINDARATSPVSPRFAWSADVQGNRLAIRPTGAPEREDLLASSLAFTPDATAGSVAGHFNVNTGAYLLGPGGLGVGGFHTSGTPGDDGYPPKPSDYDAAYPVIDREVNLFNLMVLSDDASVEVQQLYGPASVFCQKRRAVLLMDAPSTWTSVQEAIHPTSGVNALRTGLVGDTAAVFFPRVTVDEGGRAVQLGAAGAIAGLAARIDGTRGVWKSPAGTEADLRGVIGLERRFTDAERGSLNPRGINILVVRSSGICNFGARTMAGDDDLPSDWKYLAIRRLALFIEESLYRGLAWVVFEPNDEPLWAQIRLNVGAFMHGLFRRGAFQGPKREAYFVKCDGETTTQNDRDLGIVNIHVGFAPLKPAEFVLLYLQQLAGQIEV